MASKSLRRIAPNPCIQAEDGPHGTRTHHSHYHSAVANVPTGSTAGAVLPNSSLGGAESGVVSDVNCRSAIQADAFLQRHEKEIARELHDNSTRGKSVLEQNIPIANLGDRAVLFDTGMGIDDLFGTSPGELMSTLRGHGQYSRH